MALPSTGLVFHVDHNDPASWPGSGSTLTDLVGALTGTMADVGEAQGGLDFDGADSVVTFAANAVFENVWSGGATIAFAVRIDSDGEANGGHILTTRETWNQVGGWSIFTELESGSNVDIGIFQAFTGSSPDWTTTVTLGEWHIIVIRYNDSATANNARIDVDGSAASVTENVAPSGTRRSDAGRDLSIGNTSADLLRTLDGQVDAVAIWDREISDSEALDVFNTWAPRFASAPQITNITPAIDSEIFSDTEIGFDLTDAVEVLNPIVYAAAATGLVGQPIRWEAVHDGTNFLDGYTGTRTAIGGGWRYRISRIRGWDVSTPHIVVKAIDADGNVEEIA